MRRDLLIGLVSILFVFIILMVKAETVGAVSARNPERNPGPPEARVDAASHVCVPSLVWRNPELCPSYGPGTTAYRIASIHLPDPLPELPVMELPQDDEEVLPYTYAHVTILPLDVYTHPIEAAMGLPPARTMLSGDWWVRVDGKVEYDGQEWYQIGENEFVVAEALSFASGSRFQGLYLTEQPAHPFAWINRWNVQPSILPQGALNETVDPLQRYQTVTLFAEEMRGDEIWYLIGPEQWIEQSNVSRVDVNPPPQEIEPGGKWIEIDLFEQTIAAYEGERMVYATLVSSGRTATSTPPGLYKLWAKVREGKMSNPDVEDGSPAWYYIEDVPWTLYFHEGYSIHAAFWHNAFGFQRSHGCVNLAPLDAEWFYHWSDPFVPEDMKRLYIGEGSPNTWVWVHFSSPFDETEEVEEEQN